MVVSGLRIVQRLPSAEKNKERDCNRRGSEQ